MIAVLQTEGRRFGLVVDRVLNTEEIVVKPLSSQLKSIGLYSGATILGDGAVALILDVQALAKRCMRQDSLERDLAPSSAVTAGDAAELDQVLLAGIGDGRQVAIPLSMVTRLEQVAASRVERVGRREVIQYRGGILPIDPARPAPARRRPRARRRPHGHRLHERAAAASPSWSRRSSTSWTTSTCAATSRTTACSAPRSSATG